MGEGINDHTRYIVDLRRHMWMGGIEVELRRLIWQIAVVGKYISAKIHESNRKLAGFKNVYDEDQLALDRISDDILKNMLRNSGFVREYASEELKDIVTIRWTVLPWWIPIWPSERSSASTKIQYLTVAGIQWSPLFILLMARSSL
jgi:fructose-1,6-bisphosphatase I